MRKITRARARAAPCTVLPHEERVRAMWNVGSAVCRRTDGSNPELELHP